MDLKIGKSLNEVDFPLILDLIVISHNRINLDLSEVNIVDVVKRSEGTLLELTTEKKKKEEDDDDN